MNLKRNNPHWKRALLLILCAVQCMALVSPAATVFAGASGERDYLVGTMPAQEGAEVGEKSSLISINEDPAWAGIASQATMKAAEGIAPIGEQKATVIDSPIAEGYANAAGATYPIFALDTGWGSLDTVTQDIMFYIELPAASSRLRINAITCNGWSFWGAPDGMEYQYLPADSDTWVNGSITTDGNKTLSLPQGFKGYVRLKVNTAENAAQFPDTTLQVQNITFLCDLFGGTHGAVRIGGVWFVSKEDHTKIQVGGGDILSMTDRGYLLATMPAQETAEIGAAASMVRISEDPAWGGISSQAAIKATEGITPIGDTKAVVIDSPISEGYLNDGGPTYPLFEVSCAWKELNTADQDLMFYIELPAGSSQIRFWAITCNNWSFWIAPASMQYQYLSVDSDQWIDGKISTDGNKTLALTDGFKGYVRLRVNTAENAAQFPAAKLTVQDFSFRADVFGGTNGAVKLSGVWFVSKEDHTKIRVGEGEVIDMIKEEEPEPTTEPVTEPATEPAVRDYLLGTAPAKEGADIGAVSSMVNIDEDKAWAGISSQAAMKAAEGITLLSDQKATVIDSPIREGYASADGATYPIFALNCGWGRLDTATQDIMFYIELPAGSSGMRINAITCNGWSFWVSPKGMDYQYLSVDADAWVNGEISTDDSKDLKLPEGFKGYVRLKVNTAENAAQFPDTTLQVQNFTFQCQRFGSDYGPVKLDGVWFVSKEDFIKIQVDEGQILNMTNAGTPDPDPEPTTEPATEPPTEPDTEPGTEPDTEPAVRDYLLGAMPAQENADIGAASSLIKIDEDPAWAGITSQATMQATAGIAPVGAQKATVINSAIREGYFSADGATYPVFALDCGWGSLNTATQDIMFYIELPADSSNMRIHAVTCNGWTFWADAAGMEYQYLANDDNRWVSGQISTDGNKSLSLTAGFKGYVRLKINTASNAADFPDATLQVQNFTFLCERFGGDYGPVTLGGVWFVSKENFVKIQVSGGEVVKMTDAPDPEPSTEPATEPDAEPGTEPAERDYLLGEMPAQETAQIGAVSSMVVVSEDPAWGGIASQATIQAAEGITIIGSQKSAVIDSSIAEGYACPAGPTYPLLEVNCAWKVLDTESQDLMFYLELPMASSEIRFWAITCNGWAFWVAPEGMQYQYLAMNSDRWENGTISTDGNKTLALPQGFKGYVRLKVNTAGNVSEFPNTKLQIQNFSFRADVFGGDYGPVKLGGVWFVSKEDFCYIRVNGAPRKVMTNYWTENEAAISQFYDLLGQLEKKDLSAAPIIDRLQNLYDAMSEAYRAKVTKEDLAKIEEYAEAVDIYRPTFLGVTLKGPGNRQQGIRAGWNADEALARECGYKVVACGAAMLFSRKYDGNSILDENTPDAVLAEGIIKDGICSAAMDIAIADYQEELLIRCYVVYENIETGEQFAVWCGSYTDQAGQSNPYLQCSLFEVANYFGVPLYGK